MKKFKTLKINIKPDKKNGISSNKDIKFTLSDGQSLGLIQSFNLKADINNYPKLTIETLATEAECEILQKETDLNIKIIK